MYDPFFQKKNNTENGKKHSTKKWKQNLHLWGLQRREGHWKWSGLPDKKEFGRGSSCRQEWRRIERSVFFFFLSWYRLKSSIERINCRLESPKYTTNNHLIVNRGSFQIACGLQCRTCSAAPIAGSYPLRSTKTHLWSGPWPLHHYFPWLNMILIPIL